MNFYSKYRISLLASLLLMAVSLDGMALGLGEVRVDSFLNQPLEVRIRLLDASDEELDSLTASIAGSDDFERLGLMGSVLALNLITEVDRSASPAILRIRSERSVTDPVLQLLMDVRWSGGRVLREYTLFLDPATVEVEPPPPPPSSELAPASDSEPRAESTASNAPPPMPSTAPPRARAAGTRYGPVSTGDTLWAIASENRPASDLSMDQMMLAIVDLNPRAFRDGNINRLLRGAELQLPSAEQARVRDAAAAAAEVAAQNRAFRSGLATPPRVSDAGRVEADADTAPTNEGAASAASQGDQPRLSLVPPQGDPTGSGTGDDEVEALSSMQQRLARAEEELYAARQETEDYRDRIAELERLIQAQAAGLGVEEADMASLEERLREARASEAMEPVVEDADQADGSGEGDAFADNEDVPAPIEPEAEAAAFESGEDGPVLQTAENEQGSSDSSPIPDAGAPAEQNTASRNSVFGPILANPMWVAGLALLVLFVVVAVVLLLLRRRAADEKLAHPLRRARDLPGATQGGTRDAATRARDQLAQSPTSLTAHLSLLRALAADQSVEAFSRALEDMYAKVEDEEDSTWKEALSLASTVVPDHALVKGSSDWIATRDAGADENAEDSLEDDTRVDDLMARLDADMDEGDDSEWLTEEVDEPEAPDEGPRLRELDEPIAKSQSTGSPKSDQDSDDDEPVPLPGIEVDDPNVYQADSTAEDDDSDDLVLDWPDVDDDSASESKGSSLEDKGDVDEDEDEALRLNPEAKPSSRRSEESESSSDIFAQTEDDIEVKLDLARAYLSWNTPESARTLLQEIINEGSEAQSQEARKLLDGLGSNPDNESDS